MREAVWATVCLLLTAASVPARAESPVSGGKISAVEEPGAAPPPPPSTVSPTLPGSGSGSIILSGAVTDFPEAAKALGHHGKVVFSVLVGADGTLQASELVNSSHSPLLDAAATQALEKAKFRVAAMAGNRQGELRGQVVYKFYKWELPGDDRRFSGYSCADFTLDQDWWDSVSPEKNGKREPDALDRILLGSRTLLQPGGVFAGGLAGFRSMVAAHRAEWDAARMKCRSHPDQMFVDVLEAPSRKMLLSLTQMDRRAQERR
ncbi:energy transducer TonB [Novosphingobium colocasiae]|uniref:TonB C-terminal domain-containing protein n=1 Tax=Novosphingobium colocasiae TaxID=1256513 RepID=A0A918PM98_9SPHN|nr:energy transducer TonB [Novosphingobium colocasiae]GGZ13696.1 hypothetical protein GCM10011614_30940 [Novosphingobium colocasiae]